MKDGRPGTRHKGGDASVTNQQTGDITLMNPTLVGKNVAILIANGFDENQMTEIQRALVKVKANVKTIAPENGVVNGWQGTAWGHYFPVDAQINEALGSDFDILIIPGGDRSIAKLRTNAHTRRIVSHFIDANKPVAAIGAGTSLLAVTASIKGHTIAAPEETHDLLKTAGVVISSASQEVDGNVLSATGDDVSAWVLSALEFFAETEIISEAA